MFPLRQDIDLLGKYEITKTLVGLFVKYCGMFGQLVQ